MIERTNPGVDVDRLVSRIRDEVELYELGVEDSFAVEAERPPSERSVRALLAIARAKSLPRVRWSQRLAIFPFTLPVVQRVALRALGYVFRDQRHVNDALIEAARELLAANEALQLRVLALEAQADVLARSDG